MKEAGDSTLYFLFTFSRGLVGLASGPDCHWSAALVPGGRSGHCGSSVVDSSSKREM